MVQIKALRNCKNFKAVDQDLGAPFRRRFDNNCKSCVYFSSRNCGMDVSDSIEPTIDFF